MWLLIPVLLTLHIAVCLLLVLAVLMQLPRSEGLGAAFGGGVTDNIFGAQTTNVLAKFTVWLGVGFFVLTLVLSIAYAKMPTAKASTVNQELMSAPVPVATPTPAPSMEPVTEKTSETEAVSTPAPVEEVVEAVETVESTAPEALGTSASPTPIESPAASPATSPVAP